MKIEVGKTYVDGRGRRVRIIATDRHGAIVDQFSVVGLIDCGEHEAIRTFTLKGQYSVHKRTDEDLVREVRPYDHIKRGDVVHHVFNGEPQLSHFYGLSASDKPLIYAGFASPWTAAPNPTVLCVEHVELVEALNLNLE